ncbi:MAG: DoxX family protein [Ginsengibacter sp.]
MSKFLSIRYSVGAFNFGMLVLRVVLGLLVANHGYTKFVQFNTLRYKFMNFMHLGSTVSLCLIIFAELICGILLILGLFTRLACIPIIIGMSVVVFIAANGHIFAEGERGMMYLAATVTILFCGPGRISVDGMMRK